MKVQNHQEKFGHLLKARQNILLLHHQQHHLNHQRLV